MPPGVPVVLRVTPSFATTVRSWSILSFSKVPRPESLAMTNGEREELYAPMFYEQI
jgi:hypothetical protein